MGKDIRYTDSKFRLEYRKSDNLHLKQGRYVSPSNYKLPIFARGYYGDSVQKMNFHIDVKTNGRN